VRLWPRRPRRAERDLDDRGEEISRDLVERGLRDLDERSGFFGRLERRLLPEREREHERERRDDAG
jgi:hypothetical protein